MYKWVHIALIPTFGGSCPQLADLDFQLHAVSPLSLPPRLPGRHLTRQQTQVSSPGKGCSVFRRCALGSAAPPGDHTVSAAAALLRLRQLLTLLGCFLGVWVGVGVGMRVGTVFLQLRLQDAKAESSLWEHDVL